jgi:DtxR family Mn-dependent transcriptional regulator
MESKSSRPSPTIEDYLGVIYTLERDGQTVIGVRLAEWLEVSAPTVTATLKRMVRDGWVVMDPSKEIHLTASGRKAATSLIRRHMLTELLLARVLGISWSRVHQEADEMEHTISGETVSALLSRLDEPQTCPHGNPLPGHEELLKDWVPLTETPKGSRVIIQRIHESVENKPQAMVFLESQGIMPGAEAWVEDVIPLNETMTLRVEGRLVVLGLAIARAVHVQPLD